MANISGSGGNPPKVFIHVRNESADSYYDAKGKVHKAGKEKTRVLVGENTDKRFSFAAKVISNSPWGSIKAFFLKNRYVELKIKDQDKRILLNINSLAKRCHVSKKEIRNAAEQGGLLRLIRNATTESGKVHDAIDQYNLKQKDTGLTPENLMKAVKLALDPGRAEKGLIVKTEKGSYLLKLDDGKMTFRKLEQGEKPGAEIFNTGTGKMSPAVPSRIVMPEGPRREPVAEKNPPTVPERPVGGFPKSVSEESTTIEPAHIEPEEIESSIDESLEVDRKEGEVEVPVEEFEVTASDVSVSAPVSEEKPVKSPEDYFHELMETKVAGKNVFEVKEGKIYSVETGKKIGLTKETLMKTIDIAISNPPFAEIIPSESSKVSSSYMVDYEPLQGRISLLSIKQEALGEGSFGTVLEAADYAKTHFESEAFKITRPDISHFRSANESIINEYELAQKFEPGLGAPLRPRRIVKISGGEGLPDRVGYLAPKCDSDYWGYADNNQGTTEDCLFEAYQIISGLKIMSDQKIVHMDLKAENILVRNIEIDNEVIPLLSIADLGGAADFSAEGEEWKNTSTTYTPDFTLMEDLIEVNQLILESNKPENSSPEKQQEFKDRVLAIRQAQDVFATGVMIYERLTGDYPYEIYSEEVPSHAENLKRFPVLKGHPVIPIGWKPDSIPFMPELDELLIGMLMDKPGERLTPAQVKEKFEEILSRDDVASADTKEVREKIGKVKAALGYA